MRTQLVRQPRADHRIGPREIEVIDNGSHIKRRSADDNRDSVAGYAVCDGLPCELLELRHCCVFGDIEQINHVMVDFGTLGL